MFSNSFAHNIFLSGAKTGAFTFFLPVIMSANISAAATDVVIPQRLKSVATYTFGIEGLYLPIYGMPSSVTQS